MIRPNLSLGHKLVAIGAAFFAVALLGVGFLAWANSHFESDARAALQAERLRTDLLGMEAARQNLDTIDGVRWQQRLGEDIAALGQANGVGRLDWPRGTPDPGRHAAIERAWAAAQQEAALIAVSAGLPPTAANPLAAVVHEVELYAQAAQQGMDLWSRRVHLAHLLLLLLAASAAVVSVLLGHAMVLRPIRRLREVLREVRQGQLQTRLPVRTRDELGQLAAGFNRMARALEAARQDLERKVREKTASLEERNRHLAALHAVSATVARAADLDDLTQGFAEHVREIAACDGIAVWLSDQDNSRYSLLAADGLPAELLAHEAALADGPCACCPGVGDDAVRVTVLSAAAAGSTRCYTAGYRAVVAIPVQWHARLLGQATLFYRQAAQIPPPAIQHLLQAMARHFASAIENLRVAALEREAAVTTERKLIARELHDSIAQSLAFLKIQVGLLRTAVAHARDADRDRTLAELDAGVQECLSDVRELLVHFRTRTQDEDIEQALRVTLSKFELQTGIRTRMSLHGYGVPLPPDVQIHVLHVVQEALSNVRKHAAGASEVELRVQRHPYWRVAVRDDGCGFDPQQVAADPLHVGLDIMRERAERIGARMQVRSTPGGRGTEVVIELPGAGVQKLDASSAPAASLI